MTCSVRITPVDGGQGPEDIAGSYVEYKFENMHANMNFEQMFHLSLVYETNLRCTVNGSRILWFNLPVPFARNVHDSIVES